MSSRRVDAYRALSSNTRQCILRLLFRGPLGVEEMAEKLGLQPVSIRHHLKALEEASIIESFEEEPRGIGRPRVLYKVAKKPQMVSFPRRGYLALSEFFIDTAEFVLGERAARELLTRVGMEMGESTCKKLEAEHMIREWTLKDFRDYFVNQYLEEMGAEPEVVRFDETSIVYRLHNCLFLELAVKKPKVVCDVLHDSYHQGLIKAMSERIKMTRGKCIAEGDPYCEHRCEWFPPTAQNPLRPTVQSGSGGHSARSQSPRRHLVERN
ncbi:MAG: ArsR family transcriptional regulator [Candidatus Bathyarchaeia archaeon]